MPLPISTTLSVPAAAAALALCRAAYNYSRTSVQAEVAALGYEAVCFCCDRGACQGFTVQAPEFVAVVFRGTSNIEGWLRDFQVRLVSEPHYAGRVEDGFSSSLASGYEQILATLPDTSDPRPVIPMGHSLGGALAVLAAERLIPEAKGGGAVYSFGCPRVGDATFADAYPVPHYRFVNAVDPVPHAPLEEWGYKHCGERQLIEGGTLNQTRTRWEQLKADALAMMQARLGNPVSLWPEVTYHFADAYAAALAGLSTVLAA